MLPKNPDTLTKIIDDLGEKKSTNYYDPLIKYYDIFDLIYPTLDQIDVTSTSTIIDTNPLKLRYDQKLLSA